MKYRLFSMVASIAAFVAALGIQPTSWGLMYQAEIPEELKRN